MKKILSVFLAAAMLTAVFSFGASAYGAYRSNGVQEAIDHIRQTYDDGTYFTSDGEVCYSNESSYCQLSNIPARGDLPSGYAVMMATSNECWSCRAFANYVFYLIYGEVYWDLKETDTPVLGDYIKMNGGAHSAIYLWEDDEFYYVYDGNGNHDNAVRYNDRFRKSGWYISNIYHAESYDDVMASSKPEHRRFAEDEYALGSSYKGVYLENDGGSAVFGSCYYPDYAPLIVKGHTSYVQFALKEDENMVLTLNGTDENTELTFEKNTGAAKQKWSCEETAGGYFIRSLTDSSKVLQYDGEELLLTDYTGAASQMFTLEHLNHHYAEKVVKESTCTEYGLCEYTCTVCNDSFTETMWLKPHQFVSGGTVDPTATTYGFTRYVCEVCGAKERTDITEKLEPGSLVNTKKIKQFPDGTVFADPSLTEDELFDAFPSAEANWEPAVSSGTTLDTWWPCYEGMLLVIVPGDIDGDGITAASDARTALRVSVGLDETDRYWKDIAADVDFDGEITAADARVILRLSVGLDKAADILEKALTEYVF